MGRPIYIYFRYSLSSIFKIFSFIVYNIIIILRRKKERKRRPETKKAMINRPLLNINFNDNHASVSDCKHQSKSYANLSHISNSQSPCFYVCFFFPPERITLKKASKKFEKKLYECVWRTVKRGFGKGIHNGYVFLNIELKKVSVLKVAIWYYSNDCV